LVHYNYADSPTWVLIRQQFSSGVRQRELVSVDHVLCSLAPTLPLLTRSERRSYPLLLRWFEQNWSQIAPYFSGIHLRDSDGEIIIFERERETTLRNRSFGLR
jgi:hypothetical protein